MTANVIMDRRGYPLYSLPVFKPFLRLRDKLIRPWFLPKSYYEIDEVYNSEGYGCLLKLGDKIELAVYYDLPKDIIVKRSPIIPRKKFYYLDFKSSEAVNSYFYILYISPFIIHDIYSGNNLTAQIFGNKMKAYYEDLSDQTTAWFPGSKQEPFRGCRRATQEAN